MIIWGPSIASLWDEGDEVVIERRRGRKKVEGMERITVGVGVGKVVIDSGDDKFIH
jgi:hypothetical protein